MPRKAKQQPAVDRIDAADIDHAALADAHRAVEQRSHDLAIVQERFGVELPYNLDIYIARARQNAAESAMRLIEIGLLLIQIRERETTDVFREAVDRIGIAPRFAQRSMQAAIRLQDRPNVAKLGVSKALELLAEDDDTLDALDGGGSVAGLSIDEIDRMTTREVRAALRAERREREDEKAALDELIARKDKRINALQSDKRKLSRSATREQVANLLTDMDAAAVDAANLLQQLRDGASQVRATYEEAGESVDEDVAARLDQNLQFAVAQLQQLVEELGE